MYFLKMNAEMKQGFIIINEYVPVLQNILLGSGISTINWLVMPLNK